METALTDEQKRDLKVLGDFIAVYCRAKHQGQQEIELPEDLAGRFRRKPRLCPECAELLAYGISRRRRCPLDPKPSCKNCHIHCYGKEYRQRIREIMAFSGRKMILRGRLDYLYHYLR